MFNIDDDEPQEAEGDSLEDHRSPGRMLEASQGKKKIVDTGLLNKVSVNDHVAYYVSKQEKTFSVGK